MLQFDIPIDYSQILASTNFGSLAWLVGIILGLLIGPIGLMVGVRIFGSGESSYGKCFATYLIVEIIFIVLGASIILGTFLDAMIVLVISLVAVIFCCCCYPKMVSSRHDLQSWFKGLVVIIIAAIVVQVIMWVLNSFLIGFIPNIQLFTL